MLNPPRANLLGKSMLLLSNSARLARWLYGGKEQSTSSTSPEQRVDLPRPVPVYLTYLTALPSGGAITFLPDVYKRDPAALALLGNDRKIASR